METTRVRLGSVLEWLLAAALFIAILTAGSWMLGELRSVRPVMPVSAREAPGPEPPAAIPPRAVAVPVLVLADGGEIRVGEPAASVIARLGPRAEIGSEMVDRSASRERVTRSYEYAGTRFAVVFERSGPDADLIVAGIYRR